jgi:hypothetical protein
VHSVSTVRVACENMLRTKVEYEYTSTGMSVLLQRVCRERAKSVQSKYRESADTIQSESAQGVCREHSAYRGRAESAKREQREVMLVV